MSVDCIAKDVSIVGSSRPTTASSSVGPLRLPLVDALRALAATIILGHHFSNYPPLAHAAMPIAGPLINWLQDNGRVAQVFIVMSGFILASSLSHRQWDRRRAGRFIVQRYFRLALPYLAAAALAVVACAYGRDWIDDDVVGAFPTVQQWVAHVMFLQDILGYESLSAGLWFVCISFQLTVIYVLGLVIRDTVRSGGPSRIRRHLSWLPMALAWLLAGASLFHFNRDNSWEVWAVYFFGQFFLGVLVHNALSNPRAQRPLAIYIALMGIALAWEWRSRLALALATGLMLFIGGKLGVLTRWPTNRAIEYLGRISYSLFLIHFPVLIVVATFWVQHEWTSSTGAVAGLIVAYLASLAAATMFYRFIEAPVTRWSRRFA